MPSLCDDDNLPAGGVDPILGALLGYTGAVESPRVIGRYALHGRISSGGMATVYYGRLLGPVGFSRTVAIKQLHPQFSRDPDFVSMFVDEAHLAARIRHPNVVPVLDVVKSGRELYLVMDYVLGASLAEIIGAAARADRVIPHAVVTAVVSGCLRGLHAAHETKDDEGRLLDIVHRDVSPGNVLVGRDGLARVLDFGIAKAAGRAQVTRHGELKGKVGYMAPEQLRTGDVDRRADIYSVGVVLWEALTRKRAFAGDSDEVFNLRRRQTAVLPPPSRHDDGLTGFDATVARALAREPSERFETAEAFADALESCQAPMSIREVSRFVEEMVGESVERRARIAGELEKAASPEEVRAAIRDEVGVSIDDTPSINVSTWTDPSIDILDLVSSQEDGTTRESPSSRKDKAAEEAVTEVRSVADLPPAAPSAPLALMTPSMRSESAPPAVSSPAAPARAELWPWMIAGGMLAVLVGGGVAFGMFGHEAETHAAAPMVPVAKTSTTPLASSSPVPSSTPSAVSVPSSEPSAIDLDLPSAKSSAPVVTPRPTATAAAQSDPFDSLGGRH